MDKEIPASVRRRAKIRTLLIALASVGVIAIAGYLLLSLGEKSIKGANLTFSTVDTGNVENTVGAQGKVVPAYEEVVVSPVSSRILEVFHREGETVEKGEPLLRLDTQTAEGEVRRLDDQLAMQRNTTVEARLDSRTSLTNLEMQIEAKRLAVDELEAQVRNERRLDSIGSGTGDRVRQAELAWRTGVIELDQLRKQLANERQAQAARLESRRLEENIQQRTLEEARRVLRDAGVTAPRRATITFINSNIGGSVSPGEKLAVLSDLDSFRISGELPEGEASKLVAGGLVEVKLGKARLRGRISSITPQSTNGMVGFNVLLDDPGDQRLRAGIRADLNIICGLKENVPRIATGSYFHGPGPYDLFVVSTDGAHLERRRVTLGDSNFDYVEVISGLRPGEKVVISDMSDHRGSPSLRLK